ncbi:tetrathionate reductase family octaheme c-type cytochrome [Desulfatitalea alkaliphila]|uniref:Tetrathionate reductase family octaheme c-type cytochrome n=1 Tax=Desulfatitalea alkaliphila TaxID=2929485 RepID=A0AA41R446_9BACT|nr:tetrathionate reductase family octaheme c-type cytochrome [Desulfatitalea alkaliphila]MCJ8501622.1 tetrathionate reductase family octaheme c-type cytochrome [Desulfatitalea alkaliphila]
MARGMSRWLWVSALVFCAMLALARIGCDAAADKIAPGRVMARQAVERQARWNTTDHSRHAALQQSFASGDAITQACLSCHTEAEAQLHETLHWTWIDPLSPPDRIVGKAGHSLNNFCLSTNFMTDRKCLDCHIGWNGKQGRVNCLRCHGRQPLDWAAAFEAYRKLSGSSEVADQARAAEVQQEIRAAVQQVGLPTRAHCGACHFYGGGGDGVKHGDLDSSMAHPDRQLDVHMGGDGQGFHCTRCHTTRQHHIAGRVYGTPAVTARRSLLEDDLTPKITCEACHGATPHPAGSKTNDHTDKVACQSCHIPAFARRLPTKTGWDWSQAGRRRDGQPYTDPGPLGMPAYQSIKGEMTWTRDGIPAYFWFDGAIETLTVKDVIDPDTVVHVGWPVGRPEDPGARIFPFKVHRGKQPYDTVHHTLLPPLLSGPQGFWTTLDWPEALRIGAERMGIPYSGQFAFVESRYVFPTTHMVAPKDRALRCEACHTRHDGRLARLGGFYMPGRDRWPWLDGAGWLLVLGALALSGVHGLGRIVARRRGKEDRR